jgi:hypothetical protein
MGTEALLECRKCSKRMELITLLRGMLSQSQQEAAGRHVRGPNYMPAGVAQLSQTGPAVCTGLASMLRMFEAFQALHRHV